MFKRIKEFLTSLVHENNNNTLDGIIISSIDEALNSKDFYEEMKKTIIKKLCDFTEQSLSYGGDAYQLVSKKINECIVSGIEKSDFSHYTVRLEKVLNDILNEMKTQDGSIVEHYQILENFKSLMCPSKELPNESIAFEDLFEKYCQFVKETIDVQDEDVKVYYKIHTENIGYKAYKDRYVTFYVEDYENKGYFHSFSMFSSIVENEWKYTITTVPADKFRNVLSVKDLTWFDIFMLQARDKFVKVIFDPTKDYEGEDYEIIIINNEEE